MPTTVLAKCGECKVISTMTFQEDPLAAVPGVSEIYVTCSACGTHWHIGWTSTALEEARVRLKTETGRRRIKTNHWLAKEQKRLNDEMYEKGKREVA